MFRHTASLAIAAALVTVVGAPRTARAIDATSNPSQRETDWYGWQLLLADGIALGLWAPGGFRLATDSNFANHEFGGVLAAGLVTGLVLTTLGTPFVHLAHDHPKRLIGSMAARLLIPLAVAAVTSTAGLGCEDSGDQRCHDEAAMNSARWTFGSLLVVQAIDAMTASDERVLVSGLPNGRGVRLTLRF